MQKYQNNVTGRNGDVVIGGSVLITLAGTSTPATIYSDAGITPVTNPLTTDANGYFEFYAADGTYDISVNGTEAYTAVPVVDALAGLAGRPTTSELAASGGADLIGALVEGTVQAAIDARPTSSVLAASGGAGLVGYDGGTSQDVLDNAKTLQDYTALRAYTGRATGLRITAAGVAGVFQRDASDTTSADDAGTIIVDASGRRWKRVFDGPVNVEWFGALPWPTNSNDAFKAVAAFINAQSGGSILIPPKVWKVGKQTLAGATGLGYSYFADDCLRITNCTKPVVIYCDGAVIRNDPTMRYGAFDPVTGVADTVSTSNTDHSASYPAQFRFKSNVSVDIVGSLELDGNQNNGVVNNLMTFEDWGYGLHLDNNSQVRTGSIYSHHHPTDCLYLADQGLTATDPKKPHTFGNLRLEYSGRNNFTIVGSNLVHVGGGSASNAGGSIVQKLPMSNFHLERQSAVIDDTTLVNFHARGVGTGFNLGSATRVMMIGCTGGPILSRYTVGLVTHGCKFHGSTFSDPLSDITVSPNYPRYNDTEFNNTGDASGGMPLNFGSGAATFTRCKLVQSFADGTRLMATTDAGADVANINFTDCDLTEAGTTGGATQVVANFFGRNKFSAARNINFGAAQLFGDLLLTGTTPAGSSLTSVSGAGRLYLSGVESPIPGKKNSSYYRAIQYSGNDGVTSNAIGRQIFDYRTAQMVTVFGAANAGDLIWNSKQDVPALAFRAMTSGATPTWSPVGQIGLITSIAAAPPFLPCFAYVGGIGYMAVGTSSAADWKQIT